MLTTHYLDEAERLADRLAILQDGKIQVCGPAREIAKQAGLPTTITFTYPERIVAPLPPPASLGMTVDGDVATCHADNAGVALRELFAWAAANDLGDLENLVVVNPTLEDAYLQLVSGDAQ